MENKKHPNCLIRRDVSNIINDDIEYFKRQLKRVKRAEKEIYKKQIKILKDSVVIYKLGRPYDLYTTKTQTKLV